MPMRVRFTSLPAHMLPNSKLATLGAGLSASQTSEFVEDIVRRWRSVAMRD